DGQTGVDLVDAGDGDDRMVDRINAGGADSPDRYTCGAGVDRVDADIADIVADDCEQVTRPVVGPGGGLVVGPVAPDSGPQPGPCGLDVLGTATADRLAGDGGRNRIFGLVGDDDLRGGGGADCLYGGQGKDRVAGQAGADVVAGGAGDDRLAGHGGRDRLSGGAGDDVLRVGGGRNVAEGGGGDDVVVSANGRRDVIRCGPGADRVRADRVDRLRGCEKVRRGG
ncbi:MAG TPA: hypothetical protein VK631_25595, partial [Solirubrobacteraceae bacterium]|nr:hypothetical protein [Solirubrobacteraceae bacterium]